MRGAALLLLPWLLVGCMNDFEGFSYSDGSEERAVSQSDAGQASADADSPDAPRGSADGAAGTQAGDAQGAGSGDPDDVPDGAPNAEHDAATDAGSGRDAGQTVEPDEDAGPPLSPRELVCRDTLAVDDAACTGCACGQCIGEVESCFGADGQAPDPLCSAVVECALANDCRFWGCYCRNPQCARSSASGDGPCVAAMEAAAGGAKSVVMAKWTSSDLDDPLVRARNLISCVLGLDAQHPQGPIVGHCSEQCM